LQERFGPCDCCTPALADLRKGNELILEGTPVRVKYFAAELIEGPNAKNRRAPYKALDPKSELESYDSTFLPVVIELAVKRIWQWPGAKPATVMLHQWVQPGNCVLEFSKP
jgi:hypothetical protein